MGVVENPEILKEKKMYRQARRYLSQMHTSTIPFIREKANCWKKIF